MEEKPKPRRQPFSVSSLKSYFLRQRAVYAEDRSTEENETDQILFSKIKFKAKSPVLTKNNHISEVYTKQFWLEWQKRNHYQSSRILPTVLLQTFEEKFYLGVVYQLLLLALQLGQPLLIGFLVRLTQSNNNQSSYGIVWGFLSAGAFAFVSFLSSSLLAKSLENCKILGLLIQTVLTEVLFEEQFNHQRRCTPDHFMGKEMNLFLIDVEKCNQAIHFIHFLWYTPLLFFCLMGVLYFSLDFYVVLVGCVFLFIIFFPGLFWWIKSSITVRYDHYRQGGDDRLLQFHSLLNLSAESKDQSNEEMTDKDLLSVRKKETDALSHYLRWTGIIREIIFAGPAIVLMITVLFGNYLSPYVPNPSSSQHSLMTIDQFFQVIAVLNIIRFPVNRFNEAIKNLNDGYVSINRIESYLLSNLTNDHLSQSEKVDAGKSLTIADIRSDAAANDSNDKGFEALNQELFSSNELIAVIYKDSLSSKSPSFPTTISEKMKSKFVSGKVSPVTGTIAYLPESNFFYHGSLRENVSLKLADRDWDVSANHVPPAGPDEDCVHPRAKSNPIPENNEDNVDDPFYLEALFISNLLSEIQNTFAQADLTISKFINFYFNPFNHLPFVLLVEKHGRNLTASQQKQLNIARYFYQIIKFTNPIDFLLLHDPFSSIEDQSTVHHIFQHGLLHHRIYSTITRMVIITSNYHLLKYFDRILILDEGRIIAEGSFDRLFDCYPELMHEITKIPLKPVATRWIGVRRLEELEKEMAKQHESADKEKTVVTNFLHDATAESRNTEDMKLVDVVDDDELNQKIQKVASNESLPSSTSIKTSKSGKLTKPRFQNRFRPSICRVSFFLPPLPATTVTLLVPESTTELPEYVPMDKQVLPSIKILNSTVTVHPFSNHGLESSPSSSLLKSFFHYCSAALNVSLQVPHNRPSLSDNQKKQRKHQYSTIFMIFKGITFSLVIILIFSLAQFFGVFVDLYLAKYIQSINEANPNNSTTSIRLYYYYFCFLAFLFMLILRSLFIQFLALRACQVLYNKVIRQIMLSTKTNIFSFSSSSSSLFIRLSQDMDILDTVIPNDLLLFFNNFFQIMTIFLICIWVSYYFVILIPLFMMVYWKFYSDFMKLWKIDRKNEMKYQEWMFESYHELLLWNNYIYHVNQMITIFHPEGQSKLERTMPDNEDEEEQAPKGNRQVGEAYKSTKRFTSFQHLLSCYYDATNQSFLHQRSMITRLDSFTSFIFFILTIIAMTMKGLISPIAFGLMMTYGIQLSLLCQRAIQLLIDLTESFQSVERILDLIKLLPLSDIPSSS